MSAYTKLLGKRLCENCGKAATVEVFNTRNSNMGFRCTPCGNRLVQRLDRQESDDMDRRLKGLKS